ncbi:putative phosrestin-1 [Penaeus vannamei]|uniref:Putative phosrestin-1 n=1 Tax=Penaeus vannamei TaxID=6689 RepID=A0A423SCC2_PENVA|nr:putative phosrestin-1 [Penaeus vannamei]
MTTCVEGGSSRAWRSPTATAARRMRSWDFTSARSSSSSTPRSRSHAGDVQMTDAQERLIKKLGANAYPISVNLPENAPCSVSLDGGSCTLLTARRNVLTSGTPSALLSEKVQYACPGSSNRQPQTLVSKGFTLSPGRLNLEVTLPQDVYFHGQPIEATLSVNNV